MWVMQALRIEQQRVRFALISAFFAEIKALYLGRRAFSLPSLTPCKICDILRRLQLDSAGI
jgi:hypothetical protein